jgi:hypothetical protein
MVGVMAIPVRSQPGLSRTQRDDAWVNRPLTARETAEIARLSDVLISRESRGDPYEDAGEYPTVQIPEGGVNFLDRGVALGQLDRYAHVYCRPALLAVLRDSSEGGMRVACAQSLCRTRYRGVFEYLVAMLSDDDISVVDSSIWLIRVLVGDQAEFEFDIYGSVEVRKHQAEKISKWWNENRGRARLHFEFTGGIP